MKKVLTLILSALMLMSLVVVGVSADGGGLLQNGDFNSGNLTGWWMRADWNGGTWQHTASGGYEGTGGLTVTGVGEGTADQNAGLFYTVSEGQEAGFAALPNEEYKLSFMVHYDEGVEADVYMDVNEGALGSAHAGGAGGWEGVSFTFTAPAEASKLKIRLVVNGLAADETITVDDISLISLSGNHKAESNGSDPAADLETQLLGDNLLDNGSFNSAAVSKWWFRVDWNGGYWMPMDGVGVDGTGGIQATGAGTGQNFENAGVYYTGQEGQEAYLQLESGKTYQVDASFFRPADYEGNLFIDINEGRLGAGKCSTNEEWETVSFRFVAPNTPIKVRIVANALASGKKAFADDIMIREVGATPTEVEEENTEPEEILPSIQAVVPSGEEVSIGEKPPVNWALIGGIAAAVVIIAAVVVVILKKKKGGKAE